MASNSDRSSTDSLKESVLMNIRSVTQSRKGGVPLHCLERDYRDLLGTPIPFRDLGYSSLQAFLKDIPKVISLRHKDGQLVAEGVADSSTAHIVSLVNRQKATKPIVRPSRRPNFVHRRGGSSISRYNSRPSKFSSSRTSPRSTFTFEEKYSKPAQSVSREIRPKSFKSHSPERPRPQQVPLKKYEPAPRFLRLQQQKQTTSLQTSNNEAYTHDSYRPEITNKRTDSRDSFTENFISPPNHNTYVNKSPRPLTRTIVNDRWQNNLKDRLKNAATAKEYIAIYASAQNLAPEYLAKSFGQKKRTKEFFATLHLGTKKYQTYPDPASTIEEAEEKAAKKAMEAIEQSEEHLAYPETPIHNAEDVQILIARIEEIVAEKPSGMFTNGIVCEYENKYNEVLPTSWLDLLKNSTRVEVETLDVPYGKVPEGVNHIVRRAKYSSGSTTPSSASELEKIEYGSEDGAPRNILRRDHLPDIPKLTIPFGNEWGVYIVDASKTIAARLIDYDNLFLNMSEEMKDYYSTEPLPAYEICQDILYATHDRDADIYHRVLVQNIKDEDMVECYFVDEGVFADVCKSSLHELKPEFWKLPYQAIHMALEFEDDYMLILPDHLECLVGKSLIAQVKREVTNPAVEYFPTDPAVHKKIYSVVLWDTNNDEDINMNEFIKEYVIKLFDPKLPKPSVSSSGYYLTYVESTGEIYLRNNSSLDSWLRTCLEILSSTFEETCVQGATVTCDKICVAKYEDGKWYRARLVPNTKSCIDVNKVEVFFVDYGNTSVVLIGEVCELEPYSMFLSCVAPQAMKCELFNPLPSPDAEWTPEAVAKLVELAPLNEELLIRVIHEANDFAPAKVNLYKRTYQNGDSLIISINEMLATKPELFKFDSTKQNSLNLNFNDIRPPVPKAVLSNYNSINNVEVNPADIKPPSPANDLKWAITPDNIKSPDAFDDHDPPPLKLPDVPDKMSGFFDVVVTLASHPHNFHVQPHKTYNEMLDLQNQMNYFYNSEENLIDMEYSLLKKNSFYAVRHKDGNWYRAQLKTVVSYDQVVVKYVDYGDIHSVRMPQIQSLWSKFRYLPCQAIKASLAGVKPIEIDWNPMQCVEFQRMVQERQFVSILIKKQIIEDEGTPVIELELDLVDVSAPERDIYIRELLIEKGMAARV